MTDCTSISPLLDEYLDGGLAPEARARVETHLPGCPACRAELLAITALADEAHALPKVIAPGADLWEGIARRTALPPPRRLLLAQPLWFQLAAALALFVGGFVLALAWRGGGPESRVAALQAEYASASAELTRALASDATGLSGDTRRVVERNLEIIDQAIHEAETALAADPGNGGLEQMLVARYEQRLALLRHATAAGRRSS